MYFPRETSISFKAFGSSLSSIFSKLSSRRILFTSDENNKQQAAAAAESSSLLGHDPAESCQARAARTKSIVRSLYKALAHAASFLPEDCQQVIASDLEWWFHGPPGCDYMMRMLTGQLAATSDQSSSTNFRFEPRSVEAIGDCVIAEGWEGEVYWVHVWTLREDHGLVVITQFREYFNTWLTVKDVTGRPPVSAGHGHRRTPSPEREKLTLWRSRPADLYKRSLPGLVLAI
ncbi:unnamed protein product [Linum tenue]|uniref:Wound-induced protein 1 n=1 Tax=Linum tenue TaxID=586396 RepID=A0AAV0KPD1_9ROSI|nr:unnamed protein product [Linum tenue]